MVTDGNQFCESKELKQFLERSISLRWHPPFDQENNTTTDTGMVRYYSRCRILFIISIIDKILMWFYQLLCNFLLYIKLVFHNIIFFTLY